MYKVCKFGGSSLSNAEEWRKVKAIVESDDDRHIVVVSAIGKANKKDDKVTDLLYLIYQHHKPPYILPSYLVVIVKLFHRSADLDAVIPTEGKRGEKLCIKNLRFHSGKILDIEKHYLI